MQTVDYSKDEYHKIRHSEYLNSQFLCNAWSEFVFFEYFDGIFHKSILEFGAGLGTNLFYISQKSQCYMIEPSKIGFINANKLGIKTLTSLTDLCNCNNNKFNIILCRHVLEHVENPLKTLLDLKDFLCYNGQLKLILPVEKTKSPVKNEIDHHLYCWTPRTAINLLTKAGYTKITYRYNYFTGKKIFLPVYKYLGVKTYIFFMKILGILTNSKEIYIQAEIS